MAPFKAGDPAPAWLGPVTRGLAVATVIAASLTTAMGSMASGSGGQCRRVTLQLGSTFSYSAAWSADGERLFLAGPLEGKVFVYDESGHVVETIVNPGLGPHEFTKPLNLQATGDGGLIVHEHGNHSVWLDKEHRGVRSLRLDAEDMPEVQALHSLTPLFSDGYLVTRSIVKISGTQKWGYARLQIGETAKFLDVAVEFSSDPHAPNKRFQGLTGPSLAIADSDIYGVAFGFPSKLYQLSPEVRELGVFPAAYREIPTLPETPGNALGTAIQLRFLEKQRVAVALYGSGKYLFLLTRDPLPEHQTKWQLHQIDPQEETLVRTLVLPTHTEHLLLAPGTKYWSLIEKGPVNEVAQHEIDSMVLVPTAWIEDPANPSLQGNAGTSRCN